MSILKAVIDAGLIPAGTQLHSLAESVSVAAVLNIKGELELDGNVFSTPEEAKKYALRSINSLEDSGSALQFWGWFNEERQTWTPLEHLRAQLESRTIAHQVRTSESHPLRIDFVQHKSVKGRIGMTFCPGKQGKGLYSGMWKRNLDSDLQRLVEKEYRILVSLIEEHEFKLLGVSNFNEVIGKYPLQWIYLPIKDMQTPDYEFEQRFSAIIDELIQQLKAGHSVVLHCRGGLGRTGMVAARLLIELGDLPQLAIRKVRLSRPHTIETYAQEEYVLNKKWLVFNKD